MSKSSSFVKEECPLKEVVTKKKFVDLCVSLNLISLYGIRSVWFASGEKLPIQMGEGWILVAIYSVWKKMTRVMKRETFVLQTSFDRLFAATWLGCQTPVTEARGKILNLVATRNDHNSLGERSKLSELKVQQKVHQVSEHWNGGVFRRIWSGCAKAIMYICYMQLNYPQIHTNVVELAL